MLVSPPRVAAVAPGEVWGQWAGDPLVLAGLLLLAWCYARGVHAVWLRAGRGRVVTRWQARAWAAAMVSLLVALASPVEALAGSLFSAHMVQHVLLTVVAAPLLALSRPLVPLLQGLPHRLRRRLARAHERARPLRASTYRTGWALATAGLYVGVTWLWHLPGPYQAALERDVVHALEHATLLGAAVLLWWTILETGARTRFGYGTGIAMVFLVGLAHAGLGAVLAFSPTVLYSRYAGTAEAWDVSALDDQHLAGVLMWLPGKTVHGLAVLVLVIAWLRAVEARDLRRDTAACRVGEAG